ncbi:hypothetical protein [Pandoraea pneumonica]
MTHDLSSIGATLAKRLSRYLKDNGESEFNLNRKNVADALKTGAPACAIDSRKLRRATMQAISRLVFAKFAVQLAMPMRRRAAMISTACFRKGPRLWHRCTPRDRSNTGGFSACISRFVLCRDIDVR